MTGMRGPGAGMAKARPLAALLATAAILGLLASLPAAALHPPGAPLPTWPELFAIEPTLAAFERALELVALRRQLLNSILVVVFAVPISVLVASWAGFAMAQLGPGARRVAVGAALVLLMVPASALWVPRFVVFAQIGLTDTLAPLIAPALMGTTPFAVLLFYFSFRRIPRDLFDAARLEGMGAWAVWRRVAAPLVRPTTFAAGMLVFVAHWGNFVDALLYLASPEVYTLPLGLRTLGTLAPTLTSVLFAGAVIATVPAILAFAAVQHRFLQATRSAGWPGG